MEESKQTPRVYFSNLLLEDFKCFKGKNEINLEDENGEPFKWTVIIGNNNTGKTTILRALAGLAVVKGSHGYVPVIRYNHLYLSSLNFPSISANVNAINIVEKLTIKFLKHKTSYTLTSYPEPWLEFFKINGYGVNRQMGETTLTDDNSHSNTASLFSNDVELANTEEWLLQLELAKKRQPKANATLKKLKKVLISGILPDIIDFRFQTDEDLKNYVEFQTDYGWLRFKDLGYGYQASMTWMIDFAKRMFQRFPDSPNPLREPAVVLVDEIDLHLHPEWQRKIISFLTNIFPNTQFIVTAHSPLIVQSADKVNLVILNKKEDHVEITQPQIPTFKGWTVEEILQELMGMEDRTHSDEYIALIEQFEKALDEDDFKSAQEAFDQLNKILHPASAMRKLLRLQMSGIVHDQTS